MAVSVSTKQSTSTDGNVLSRRCYHEWFSEEVVLGEEVD